MKIRIVYPLAFFLILTFFSGCHKKSSEIEPVTSDAIQYYVKNIRPSYPVKGLTFLDVKGSLEMLRKNLENNIPTLIEWSDWGGHWVLVIGYDLRDPENIMDDVIIFADPYDYHDDHKDGITWFNAQRFYYMWYDALLFGKVMKHIYIQVVPE